MNDRYLRLEAAGLKRRSEEGGPSAPQRSIRDRRSNRRGRQD
jgi:hypothetical protein